MKKFITLLLLIGIVVGGFAAYLGSMIFVKDIRAGRAETMAAKFVTNLYAEYAIIGQNCQGEDTDGDSYVSCDLRIKNTENVEKILKLQCPTMWKSFTGNTCKESRLSIEAL